MKFNEIVASAAESVPAASTAGPSSQIKIRDMEMILNVVRKINTSLELSEVLELVTDESIRIVKADRGFLMLVGKEGKLELAVARNSQGESIVAENLQISSSVMEDVLATGESLYVENALADQRFENRQSIMDLELKTIICCPLRTQDERIGVMYVDSKRIQACDKSETLSLFEILAGQAAIAIRNARLYANLKDAYEDLRQAHEHIVKSERMAMKGELASEVSHELKNLVSVVLLSLQQLQLKIGTVSSQELNGVIEKVIGGVKKIERFSKNLLSSSRSAARLMPQNLTKIAADFTEFMKFLPKFKANTITSSFEENLPPVNLDIDQIQQVLLNLVNNIVEAKSNASIHFTTAYNPAKHEVTLSVGDDGPGIEEEVRNRLFTEKITTKPDGHGYGLLVCKQIVENHGGSIRIDSRENEGTILTLTFPVTR
jgi:K+-sensing histidine kinase KdpD